MLTAYDITGEAFHHTREDVDTLHQLAGTLPSNCCIVNIGACFGTSALALIEGKPSATIFSIDVRECPEETEHLKQANIPPGRVIRVLGRSQDVGAWWPFKVAMVFVDGAHDWSSVSSDAATWYGNLKQGGILAFHDYGAPSLPAVKEAVDVFCQPLEQIVHIGTIKAFRKAVGG